MAGEEEVGKEDSTQLSSTCMLPCLHSLQLVIRNAALRSVISLSLLNVERNKFEMHMADSGYLCKNSSRTIFMF